MKIMTSEILKKIPYEQNENKIRSLYAEIITETGNSLLDCSSKTVHSKNLDITYLLFKIAPKQVNPLSLLAIDKINHLLEVLCELCKPSGDSDELIEGMTNFIFSTGGDKYKTERAVLSICKVYIQEIKDFPQDIVNEGLRQYLIKYSGFPSLSTLIEIMDMLYSKRRSLLESLVTIMASLEKNKIGGKIVL